MERHLILRALIHDRFNGNQTEFARVIKRSPAQVNQWLTGHRKLGDAGARTIEMALGLAQGYFDQRLTYAKSSLIRSLPVREPDEDTTIAEVVRMMNATDDTGRAMVLAAAKVALAGYHPAKQSSAP